MNLFARINTKISTKKRKAGRYLMSLAAGASILIMGMVVSGCVNETFSDEKPSKTPDAEYFMSLSVSVPTEATRSNTLANGESSDDRLAGTANETTVKSATIYFCVGDKVKAEIEVNQYIQTPNSTGNTTLWTKIADLSVFKDLAGEEEVGIFIVGNASESSLSHDFGTATGKENDANKAKITFAGADSAPIEDFGTDGKIMPLSSAKKFTTDKFKEVPAYDETDPTAYVEAIKGIFSRATVTNKWWDVNQESTAIQLERAVARIDFKDKDNRAAGEEAWTYKVDSTTDLNIKLYSLQLFNINKNSYLFRHSSAGSTSNADATEGPALFDVERGNSGYTWVASHDWTSSNEGFEKDSDFYNTLTLDETDFNIDGEDTTITIAELTETENNQPKRALQDNYYPWCYVSENTLPSVELMTGEEAWKYATGIAFSFTLLDKNGKVLTKTTKAEDYPSCITASTRTEGAITIMDKDANWIDVEPDTNTGEFYITYLAYIVHNDSYSGMTAPKIPMFYGVVRNNAYQLKVKSVEGLPRANDPESYYLSLQIKVLAWAKRDINVSF